MCENALSELRYSHARVLLRIGNDIALGTGPLRLAHPEEGVWSCAVVRKGLYEQRRLVHRVDLTLGNIFLKDFSKKELA